MNSEKIYNIKYIEYIEGHKIYKNMLVLEKNLKLISKTNLTNIKIINIIER